jgi:hypothetical protein
MSFFLLSWKEAFRMLHIKHDHWGLELFFQLGERWLTLSVCWMFFNSCIRKQKEIIPVVLLQVPVFWGLGIFCPICFIFLSNLICSLCHVFCDYYRDCTVRSNLNFLISNDFSVLILIWTLFSNFDIFL